MFSPRAWLTSLASPLAADVLWLVCLSSLLLGVGSTEAYVPGALCDGLDLTAESYTLLRGRHLTVLEVAYEPFAIKDATAPHGFRGYDLDVFEQVSKILGFTYHVVAMEPLPDESWSEMLLRTVSQGDIWLSWWARNQKRMNETSMLAGHLDISPVLAIPPPSMPTDDALDKTFTTFFLPFSYPLWACLFSMILLSAAVDFCLERGNGGTFLASLYEYFGGVLFGGFQEPGSRLSAVYQCIVAFIILIVVSAYTANLASAMTVSRTPQAAFGSVDEVIASKTAACVAGDYAAQGTYESLYPNLVYDKTTAAWFDSIDEGLLDGTCKAAIVPRIEFDTWLTQGPNCKISIAGGSLFFSSAGWVTNFNSSRCVQRSIEYALHQMQGDGTLIQILAKYLPAAACGAASDEETEDGHRRLKGGSAGGDAAAAAAGADAGSEFTMPVKDFFGLFVVWCVATFIILSIKVGLHCFESRMRKSKTATDEGGDDEGGFASAIEGAVDAVFGKQHTEYPPDLDIHNTTAMLRYLVKHLGEVEDNVRKLESRGEATPTAQGGAVMELAVEAKQVRVLRAPPTPAYGDN